MKAAHSGMSLPSGSTVDLRVWGGLAGVTATVAAGLVLAGWIFDVPALRAVLPGSVGMRPRVALAFVLAGISLAMFCLERQSATKQRLAQGLAALVVLLAVAALGENALAAGPRVEPPPVGIGARGVPASDPRPTAPNTAFGVLLVGLALSLVNVETRAGMRPSQPLAMVVAMVALLGLVGYAYGVPELYSVGRYRQMAFNTAALLFLVSLGLLLARPDEGWMRAALGGGVGSVALRWLLPAVVATPILVGWVRLLGERAGLYGTEIGLSLFAIANVVILSAVVVWSARHLERLDEKRRASEARYHSLFHRNLAGVHLSALDGRILECNDSFARIFGFDSRDELMDDDDAALFPDPASRESFVARLRKDGQVVNHESEGRRRDGSRIWTLETATLIDDEAAGRVVVEGTVVDITERRVLERQLLQVQKMEALGQLAGGVAHDFNNILGVIGGYSELALRQTPAHDPRRRPLEQIHRAGERGAALTRQLLAFGRREIVEPVVLDVDEVVRGLEEMLKRLIREDIHLVTTPAAAPGLVRADRGQIEQVVLNLVVNARDAMPAGGRVLIETGHADLDEAYCQRHVGARPGPHVMLAVSDTGVGMDHQTQSRIFEPFFTTKEPGRGTGLGLSTVYGIVKQSGGSVWVYSEPGQGTTFKVFLPRAREESADPTLPADPGAPPTGTETILLVEDEPMLRSLTRELLTSLGYTVLDAGHGREALEQSARHDGPIHLLVTDVIMPGMSGSQVAARLATSRPGTKVVVISGYPDDMTTREGLADARVVFLQKPFTLNALARKVRQALDNPNGE